MNLATLPWILSCGCRFDQNPGLRCSAQGEHSLCGACRVDIAQATGQIFFQYLRM